ncbi:MAG: TIGR04283 family arsenosugar biosynthesis glycosyltransferase [Bacteroidota bacterium]
MPQLSVIIPTLNEAENLNVLLPYLQRILDSTSFEIIVADGGSEDETVQMAQAYEVTVIQSPRGRAKQLNVGANAARGTYLYFLHADTTPPLTLLEHLKWIKRQMVPAACFRLKFQSTHGLLRFLAWWTRVDFNCFRYGDQSLLVARDHFQRVGGYDEKLHLLEDNDLVVRLKQVGPFMILPDYVLTSARKYERYGVFYLQAVYTLIYLLAQLGVEQKKLLHIYRRALRSNMD